MNTPLTTLLKISWNLYTTRFRFIIISAALLIPISILDLLLLPDTAPFKGDVITQIIDGQGSRFIQDWIAGGARVEEVIDLSSMPAWLALTGLSIILTTAGNLVIWLGTALGRHNFSISTASALRQSFNLLPQALGIVILAGIFTWLGTVAFVLPGIILSIGLTFAVPSLVITQRGGMAALRDSWQTVRGSWWRVLWYTMACSVLVTIIVGLLSSPFEELLLLNLASWLTNFLIVFVDTLTMTGIGFVTVFIMVLFLDLKNKLMASAPSTEEPISPTN